MKLNIRPSPRELMELQRRCREDCQPYFDLMVREASMDTRMRWIIKPDGSLDRIERSDSPATAYARTMVDAIIKRYTALANGDEPADNADEAVNL